MRSHWVHNIVCMTSMSDQEQDTDDFEFEEALRVNRYLDSMTECRWARAWAEEKKWLNAIEEICQEVSEQLREEKSQ